ncbi:hypothetical protein BD410DRAFT_842309 [Rickenella mellea]|uniref:DUF6535 domain-containing protein n=1 Tax=Rickenella mellea TaxID=50990 RepID=A0A4Y7PW21_9AGAM|nr:hypothetical protein BD410DRAFT_842309 [Rickenella mellea]
MVLEMFGKGRRPTGMRSPSDMSTCTDIEKCAPVDESSDKSNKSPIAALPTSTTPILGPNPIPAPKTGMMYWLRRSLLHRADGDAGKPPTSEPDVETSISSDDYPMDYAKHCADTALVWKLYLTRAEHDDGALASVLNGDLESLLLFATLFSAILSAFLIEIRSVRDVENTANTSRSNWVNGLWLFSLLFGVLSAFLASLAKGWVSKYLYSSVGGENWASVKNRQNQFDYRQRVIFIVQLLPLPLHASLLFFSVGFLIYLRDDSIGIRVVVGIVVGAMVTFYFAMSFYPSLSHYSPFDTPLTTITQWMLKPWRLPKQHSEPVISAQRHSREREEEEIKATALAWLLETSVEKNIIRESVYGVAGLPVNGEIQAALRGGFVVRTLIGSFTDNMEESGHTSPTPYLHALLRLLHPERAKIPESVLRLFIPSLDKLAALDRGTYEIALFVRAHILLLLDDERTVLAELRDTAIPILQKCSSARIFCLLSHLEDDLGSVIDMSSSS